MSDAQHLLDAAKCASEHAYAPYSNFPVGAALLLESGKIIVGCNVENASFGLTICAERSALVSWISQGAKSDAIKAAAVYGGKTSGHHITPCGACRQSLVEFCAKNIPLYLFDKEGHIVVKQVHDLLPDQFTL